jgi:hypothetical protein
MSFYHRRVVQPLCSLIERNPTRSFLFGLFWMGLAHVLKTLADVFHWTPLNELAYVVPEGTPKTGQRGTHQNRPMVSGGR